MSLFQPFRLFASGRPTFGRPKVGGKTAGETPGPLLFAQSVTIKFRTGPPLKYCKASGLLVIGAVGDQPCLTALGLIGISCCAKQTDGSIPSKGRQPKLDKKPGGDQMLKKLIQWHSSIKPDRDRLGK